MFRIDQVVAIKAPREHDEPAYSRIVRIVPTDIQLSKIYLSWNADENDPRLFYTENEIRPLTKEEIEGA